MTCEKRRSFDAGRTRGLRVAPRKDAIAKSNSTVEPGINVLGRRAPDDDGAAHLARQRLEIHQPHRDGPRCAVYTEERDGQRWVCVADNGAGFDMAQADRLFKPFTRLHRQDEFIGLRPGTCDGASHRETAWRRYRSRGRGRAGHYDTVLAASLRRTETVLAPVRYAATIRFVRPSAHLAGEIVAARAKS